MPSRFPIVLVLVCLPALPAQTPEQKAIRFLAQEVPLWFTDNQCFSCHNNGDGARALFGASRRGYAVPKDALINTITWLLTPGKWDENRANPAFSDKKLARLQFAVSLSEAVDAGLVTDRSALLAAAQSLIPFQEADGSWQIDTEVTAGSPVTYGAALATYLARGVLERARGFPDPVAKATNWLRFAKPKSLLDSAALLWAEPEAQRQNLEVLMRSQTSDGGWGSQPGARAEPFDTAVAMLAIEKLDQQKALGRARAFLISSQLSGGGWPETTRPAGGQSYAQRISTSAWATMALLATDPKR